MSKPVRAIFLDMARNFWVDMARELAEQHGWEAVYWTGSPQIEAELTALFPGIMFQSGKEARLVVPHPRMKAVKPSVVDGDLIKAMAWHQVVAEKMLERFDLLNYFSFPDKARTYFQMLGYWKTVLDTLAPDVVVFPVSPHAVYDYVVYGLCRVLGVRTVVLERTTIPPYVFAQESFEEGSHALSQAYKDAVDAHAGDTVDLPPELENYLSKMTGDFATGMSPHMRAVVDNPKHAGDFGHVRQKASVTTVARLKVDSLVKRLRFAVNSVFLQGPESSFYVKPGGVLGETRMGRLMYLRHRLNVRRAKKVLRQTYDRFCTTPNLDQPYIFVALQAEPERQTTPNGGAFVYQYMMVDMLSKSVPDGWRIYVKEHVVQLNPQFTPERSRTPGFYEAMAELPNVDLVSEKEISFELIDKAKAVATVSGSSGWEAVVRGKPALLFGCAWYRDCEGMFSVDTEANLKAALSQIENGIDIDSQRVRLYVKTVSEVCERGFVDSKYEKITQISATENGAALARAVAKLYYGPNDPGRSGHETLEKI